MSIVTAYEQMLSSTLYLSKKDTTVVDITVIKEVAEAFHYGKYEEVERDAVKNKTITWLKNPHLLTRIHVEITDIFLVHGTKKIGFNDLLLCTSSSYFDNLLHGHYNKRAVPDAGIQDIEVKQDTFEKSIILNSFLHKPKLRNIQDAEQLLEILQFFDLNPRIFLGQLDDKSLSVLLTYFEKKLDHLDESYDKKFYFKIYDRALNIALGKALRDSSFRKKFDNKIKGKCRQVNLQNLKEVDPKKLEKFILNYIACKDSKVKKIIIHQLPENSVLNLEKCHLENVQIEITSPNKLKLILPKVKEVIYDGRKIN